MKKSLFVLATALLIVANSAPTFAEVAVSESSTLSKLDYIQGSRDAIAAMALDPSDQGRYNTYLYGKANYDQAVQADDQNQIDYWQGYLEAIGPVEIPY